MPQLITSSADPYWRNLSDMIVQGSISSQQQAEELREVFAESNMEKWQGHVPAYILSGWLPYDFTHTSCYSTQQLHCSHWSVPSSTGHDFYT